MKKAEFKFIKNVPDDFTPGKCDKCPLYGYSYNNMTCKISKDKTACPAKIVFEKK